MNLTHRAATLYDRALDRGDRFVIADVVEALADELHGDEASMDAVVRAAAESAVRQVDKQRTSAPPQADLFDLLGQAVAVADGARIARRNMTFEDWSQHLRHVSENAARVNASAARENERFALLAPFLARGLSTEDAVKEWREANPDAALP